MSADSSEHRSIDPKLSGDESLAAIDRLLRRDAESVMPPAGLSQRVYDASVSELPARRFKLDRRRTGILIGTQSWMRLAMAAAVAVAFVWSWNAFMPQPKMPVDVGVDVGKDTGNNDTDHRPAPVMVAFTGDENVMPTSVEEWLYPIDSAVRLVASRSIMSVEDLGFNELDAALDM